MGESPDWKRIHARKFTKRLPELRWDYAKEFVQWYEAQMFPGEPEAMCEVWMKDRFPDAAPVDYMLLRFACLRNDDDGYTRRIFRRKGD